MSKKVKRLKMYENIISVVEKKLQEIKDNYNDFDYQECDPEGSSRASKGYKEYNALWNELKQLKKDAHETIASV